MPSFRTSKLAGAALVLAATAQAIPLNLDCLQASYLALSDPDFSTCVQTQALGGILPYFFGSSNLSLVEPIDTYLEAYCPAPACNASTYEWAVQIVNGSCGSAFESVGLTNETVSFLIDNDATFKAAMCVPYNGTISTSANMTMSADNSTMAANNTTFSYCLPSLLDTFEVVSGQNVTVQLLTGIASGNISFDSLFPSLNTSSMTNSSMNVSSSMMPLNASAVADNETLTSAVCTDCVRQMYLVLEDSFGANSTVNSTAANTTMSLLSIVKAGAEAICGDDFFSINTANSTSSVGASSSSAPVPIPVSTRSVVTAGSPTSSVMASASAVSSVFSSAAAPASGVASSAAGAVASDVPAAISSAAAAATSLAETIPSAATTAAN